MIALVQRAEPHKGAGRPGTAALGPDGSPRAGRALLALAIGGFGIGTTEFVTMGVLPQIANGVGAPVTWSRRAPSASRSRPR